MLSSKPFKNLKNVAKKKDSEVYTGMIKVVHVYVVTLCCIYLVGNKRKEREKKLNKQDQRKSVERR